MSLVPFVLASAAGEAGAGPMIGEESWVALSLFVLLGVFAWLGVHRFVARSLDARRESIRKELEEARALKAEAQEALAQLQRRQNAAADDAEAMLAQAKEDARLLRADSEKKLEDLMARRRAAMEQKIAQAESDVIRELRAEAAELAVNAARRALRETLSQDVDKRVIARTIETIDSRLH